MAIIYMFDVDDTLEISRGPVKLSQLVKLKEEGNIIGICGNWAGFANAVNGWQTLISILGPIGTSKASMLYQIKTFIRADRFVLVGNHPVDFIEARDSGWEFIKESEFKGGM